MKYSILLTIIFVLFSCSSNKVSYKGHTVDDIPKETLEKYAPKDIDSSLKRTIENYLDIKGARSGLLTDDGKNFYFNWNVTGVNKIWTIDARTPFPVQLTSGKQADYVSGITPDGSKLIVVKDNNGDENYGIYWMPANGGKLTEILHKKGVRTGVNYLSSDSQFLYFSANLESKKNKFLYKYSFKNGTFKAILKEPGTWFMADRRSDGLLLVSKVLTHDKLEYYLLDEKTKKLSPLLGTDKPSNFYVEFSRTKGEYIVLTKEFDAYSTLYLYNKNKKFIKISQFDNNDVSHFTTDRTKKRVIYEISQNNYKKVAAIDLRTLKHISTPKIKKGESLKFAYTTKNGNFTFFRYDTTKEPTKTFAYNWNTKKRKIWTLASTPGVDMKKVVSSKLEYYDAIDGTKIPMFVWRPQECLKKTCPVIVNFHGGPASASSPNFSAIAKLYNDAGVIYVRPNVRGSRGYGKEWIESDDKAKRLNVITDIRDFARFAKKNWAYDSVVPKVGITGGSYGGYSTLIGMTMFAGEYDAGVSVVGMSSLVTFLQNTASYRRHLRESEYGSLKDDMDILVKLSPTTYISQVKDPIMLIQGATDPRVPAGESIQFQQTLESMGIDSELLLFEDEGHGVRKRKNKILSIGHTYKFFDKYIF